MDNVTRSILIVDVVIGVLTTYVKLEEDENKKKVLMDVKKQLEHVRVLLNQLVSGIVGNGRDSPTLSIESSLQIVQAMKIIWAIIRHLEGL